MIDPSWDRFLTNSDVGEYQQSTMWAEAKQAEGWHLSRTLLLERGQIAAGWQLLWKVRHRCRYGYISRGPVVAEDRPDLVGALSAELASAMRRENLTAVIIQPPGAASYIRFSPPAFFDYPSRSIISSTMLVDVSTGLPAVEAKIRRRKLQEVRQSVRRGVTIREARKEDLNIFFDLMLSTCRRQKTTPSPASLESLTALWNAFRDRGKIRLALAIHSGLPIAGWLSIGFGRKVTFFKTGWRADLPGLHPVSLLIHDALRWSVENNFSHCDFAGFDSRLADRILSNTPLTDDEMKQRDYYKTGFGGVPVMLSRPVIFITNPIARWIFGLLRKARASSCPR